MTLFYGIDCRQMSAVEQQTWEALMPRLQAETVLRERGGSLDPETLYRVMLTAGVEKMKAQRARARRALELSREQSAT